MPDSGSLSHELEAVLTGTQSETTTSRRGFIGAILSATGIIGVGGTALTVATGRGLALDSEAWIVNGATVETSCGQISAVTFGETDSEDEVVVHYHGLNESGRTLELDVRIRGVDDGDPDGWGGSASTSWETLASNTLTLDDTSGTLDMTWAEAFGEDRPVDVTDHSEIAIEDFELDPSGSQRDRTLEVELFASVPAEEIEHSQVGQAEVTVVVDSSPRIDEFDIENETNPNFEWIDVQWAVSDPCGDLDEVVTEVRPEGSTESVDSTTTAIDGSEASGIHDYQVEAEDSPYEVVLTVTDTYGNTTTEIKPAGEPDELEPGDTEFASLTAEVVDTRGGSSAPQAVEFVYEIDHDDPHQILFSVDVNGESASELVEGTISGTVVVDTESTGPPPDTDTAIVTADIDGGESCTTEITDDDDVVDMCG